MMLKAIIVDDEAPARSELKYMLEEEKLVDVVADVESVREAIEALKKNRCDVMFLDINMPGIDGMKFADALAQLKNPPCVVFVTAYSEHAADAFNVNAIDYLVKPVEEDRLRQAVDKVKTHIAMVNKPPEPERIPVEKAGRKILISTDDILFIMAKDDYAYLHTKKDRYLSTTSLARLEERLGEFGFYRAHRRYLVNLNYVVGVEPKSGGTLNLKLKGEEELIPVSRRRVPALKKVLGI